MSYALFYNIETDDVELYPKLEDHTLSVKDIEKYLEGLDNAGKWVIYDHLPTEEDIDDFEKLLDDDDEDDGDGDAGDD